MGEVLFAVLLVAIAAFVVFIVLRNHWMHTKDDDLRVAGVPAEARVLRVRPDPGEDDRYVLSLEMTPPEGSSYRGANGPIALELQAFLGAHAFGAIQPGATIRVRFDPRDPKRAVVDLAAMGLA